MYCNQIFSLISGGIVQNVVVADNFEIANRVARDLYGNGAIAVDTTLYPLSIGDTYENGRFYRTQNGQKTEIVRNLTEQEQLEGLRSRYDDILAMQADILAELSLNSLGIGGSV